MRTGFAVAHDDGLRTDVLQPRQRDHVRQHPQRRWLQALRAQVITASESAYVKRCSPWESNDSF